MISPSFNITWNSTLGAVVINSNSYSRSNRSCTTSMCSNPKNPHLKPKPKAEDDSGSNIIQPQLAQCFPQLTVIIRI